MNKHSPPAPPVTSRALGCLFVLCTGVSRMCFNLDEYRSESRILAIDSLLHHFNCVSASANNYFLYLFVKEATFECLVFTEAPLSMLANRRTPVIKTNNVYSTTKGECLFFADNKAEVVIYPDLLKHFNFQERFYIIVLLPRCK